MKIRLKKKKNTTKILCKQKVNANVNDSEKFLIIEHSSLASEYTN